MCVLVPFSVKPPLRTPEDQLSLWQGLNDGTIDILASDHAPNSIEDKMKEFSDVPS